MSRARLLIALTLACGCEPSKVVGYGEVDPNVPAPAVYDTIELPVQSGELPGNPFTQYVAFEFWQGLERYSVDGFYDGRDSDGDHIYKVRFMATQPGDWHFAWSIGDRSDTGRLRVDARRDSTIHGHVRVDKTTPTVLWHDDGNVHYWFGGKSFTANNYGPQRKERDENLRPEGDSAHDDYYSDAQVAAYLDLMREQGHNGTRLKIGLFPLEDDGVSWDLSWIRRAEVWIRMMQQRRIYCQITFFDARSRAKGEWFEDSNDPADHVLDAWAGDQLEEARNYIRYIVARFAGFWNVYWELVNRVDHAGDEAGDRFVQAANTFYLPWLRDYDPYDLAIGASEAPKARMMPIDIEFPRDPTLLPAPDSRRAVVLNEMVDVCIDQQGIGRPADDDAAIREPSNRHCYRSALWRAFVSGAFGANQASWLDLATSPKGSSAVLDVMRDHQRLRTIITGLGTGLEELVSDPGFVVPRSEHQGTRSKLGQLYLAYFTPGRPSESIEVRLPDGRYSYRWLDPQAPAPGQPPPIPEPPKFVVVQGNPASLQRPAYEDDLLLVVERADDDVP
ncbi:MAG TPA: DUF5060 domain-containing protein [Polyangiaceae bacterium]